jgi:DNA-binding transcriptional MocR family regulator
MNIEALPPLLRQKTELLYIVPTYQNPQDTTLSEERRLDPIRMLDHSPVPLIEDNPYGEPRYDGESVPSLLSPDAQHLGTGKSPGGLCTLEPSPKF